MKIRNKIESSMAIKNLHLNYSPEQIFKSGQEMVVEFALFNEPVGVNKENIIVYELRTEY